MEPTSIKTASLRPTLGEGETSLESLLSEAESLAPDVIALRRRIHARPELGLQLPATSGAVLEGLEGLGLEIRRGVALSSVIARLDGERPGPTVLLRADMDALPMDEETDLPYRSEVRGAAHACGHDAHTAMLVGAARLLARRRAALAGRVLFVFQPGEEGHDGAKRMLEEGLLDPSFAGEVTRAFALHQAPMYPSRTIHTRPGTMMAAVDGFRVTVHGRGGHASMPHGALDPIPVACEIVLAVQTWISRRIDVFDPAVITVAKLTAGTGRGIIPDRAVVEGTLRAFSRATHRAVAEGLTRVAEGIAAAHGLRATVEVLPGYPVTVNDPPTAEWVSALADRLVGPSRSMRMQQPVPGSEDFSYVLERVPGALAILGTRPPGVDPADVAPLHSPRMQLDEGALAVGTAMYAAVASSALATETAT